MLTWSAFMLGCVRAIQIFIGIHLASSNYQQRVGDPYFTIQPTIQTYLAQLGLVNYFHIASTLLLKSLNKFSLLFNCQLLGLGYLSGKGLAPL